MIYDAEILPSLNASVHEIAVDSMKHGVWITFKFGDSVRYNNLDFTSISIKVQSNVVGFDLLFLNKKRYDGNCLYVRLNHTTMNVLYDLITSEIDKD